VTLKIVSLTILVSLSCIDVVQATEQSSDSIWSDFLQDSKVITALIAAAVTIAINLASKLLFDRRLEKLKAELSQQHSQNEAKIKYEFEAKSRLYNAIGTLRFQLLLAARDAASQISGYGAGRRWLITTKNYYGQSTLYKLILPISLCQKIEAQISYADFSVDSGAIDLLRFKRAIYTAFTSGKSILQHPDANWEHEEQHVFRHSLDNIALSLINEDDENKAVIPLSSFAKFTSSKGGYSKISPLPELFADFTIERKPLLWCRLVLYGYLCSEFVNSVGTGIGFEPIEYDVSELLGQADDDFMISNKPRLAESFKNIRDQGI